ncbi:hypothetical protein EDB84DRAFT_1673646 [Lactarius hengduanensis]|nr:hypothetical protein EDB84DRAFT_1673646 [Lactarius hengduanensis]
MVQRSPAACCPPNRLPRRPLQAASSPSRVLLESPLEVPDFDAPWCSGSAIWCASVESCQASARHVTSYMSLLQSGTRRSKVAKGKYQRWGSRVEWMWGTTQGEVAKRYSLRLPQVSQACRMNLKSTHRRGANTTTVQRAPCRQEVEACIWGDHFLGVWEDGSRRCSYYLLANRGSSNMLSAECLTLSYLGRGTMLTVWGITLKHQDSKVPRPELPAH